MIDLAAVAGRKSTTISDLKKRGDKIHEEVGHAGKIYSLRFGDHEDMAVVPLGGLVELATAHAELLELLAALERQVAAQAGIPLLGGPEEDDIVRGRLSDPRRPGPDVIAAARAKLGLR
ncbi:MAG: hypothetical protein HY675_22525 [Chloroflexi bacterium]|nr:hypothetical protein [Chloroflexota bacterium]